MILLDDRCCNILLLVAVGEDPKEPQEEQVVHDNDAYIHYSEVALVAVDVPCYLLEVVVVENAAAEDWVDFRPPWVAAAA